VPYEIVHCLELVVQDWDKAPKLVTTALTDDPDFHFYHFNPGQIINTFVPTHDVNKQIIQIAFPTLYRHKPLYIIGLYHEIGHFIDNHLKITEWSIRKDMIAPNVKEKSHRSEFFSDLFAASYTGKAYHSFLSKFAPDDPESETHPATLDRLDNIASFLSGKENKLLQTINSVLVDLGYPRLSIKFSKPDVSSCFDNLRPYNFRNTEELHGIFEAGFDYLEKVNSAPTELWRNFADYQKDKVLNDLIEKSIRNKMITEKWNDATS
jgi:hypothetical protein